MLRNYTRIQVIDEGNSIINAIRVDGSVAVIEKHESPELWSVIQSGVLGEVFAYDPPPELTPDQKLDGERRAMSTTVVRLRIAIHRNDLTAATLATLEAHPEQEIIWNIGGSVGRTGGLARVLASEFGEAELDSIFRKAMTLEF